MFGWSQHLDLQLVKKMYENNRQGNHFKWTFIFAMKKEKKRRDCCPTYILIWSAQSLKGRLHWMINYTEIFIGDVGQVIHAIRYNCSTLTSCLVYLLGCSKQAWQYSACLEKSLNLSGSKLKFRTFFLYGTHFNQKHILWWKLFFGCNSKNSLELSGKLWPVICCRLLLTHWQRTYKALFEQYTGSSSEIIFQLHKLLKKNVAQQQQHLLELSYAPNQDGSS